MNIRKIKNQEEQQDVLFTIYFIHMVSDLAVLLIRYKLNPMTV